MATKKEVIEYIQRDMRKLERERKKITPSKVASCENETLRNYLVARYHTMKEILEILTSTKIKTQKP